MKSMQISIMSKPEKEEQFYSIAETLAEILTAKNKAYGDSFGISVRKYGLTASLTRISDKFNRLESLILNDTKGDSLEDTLMDMAGYCVLTLLEIQEGDE